MEKELKSQSHAVQRSLPRPVDVNENILRDVGPNDPALSDLQKVPIYLSYSYICTLFTAATIHQDALV